MIAACNYARELYKTRTSLKALARSRVFTIVPLYFYEYASLGHNGYTAKDMGAEFLRQKERGRRREGKAKERGTIKGKKEKRERKGAKYSVRDFL